MKQENMNFWQPQPAETVNTSLAELPTATETAIFRGDDNSKIEGRKAIVVENKVVYIPTDRYKLVQHKEAFRPIIEGLVVSGVEQFDYMMWSTLGKANMTVLVGEADDGVKFGFNVVNSYDGSNAIRFGMDAHRKQKVVDIVEREHVTLWGWRQICSNGMKVRIPLKSVKYLDAVESTKIIDLLRDSRRMLHLGDVQEKVKELQYVVEAMLLLKHPLNRMIIDAKNYKLTQQQANELIEKYTGQRRIDKYLENFKEESGNDLWSLYNSMTWLASHKESLSVSGREYVVDNASKMLVEVLTK